MQRHRFFSPPAQISDSTITLSDDEAYHLSRVLRLREGDRVFAFDGVGIEYECLIAALKKHEVELNIVRKLSDLVESPLHLTLAQALIKGDKFDWVVQKTTELGVSRIVPLLTDHGDIRRTQERAEIKLQRWRRISLESVKQSGRRRLVEIYEPISFIDYCGSNEVDGGIGETNLFFSERGGRSLQEISGGFKTVDQLRQLGLCIGSEGGWSENEIGLAGQHRFIPVTLGPRILRTETAAVTAVALAEHLFGDIK